MQVCEKRVASVSQTLMIHWRLKGDLMVPVSALDNKILASGPCLHAWWRLLALHKRN